MGIRSHLAEEPVSNLYEVPKVTYASQCMGSTQTTNTTSHIVPSTGAMRKAEKSKQLQLGPPNIGQ